MANIAIIHNKFTALGGAETVCMNFIESLQQHHSLTLFSFDEPNFRELNEFCGTAVDPIPVQRPRHIGPTYNSFISTANELTNGSLGPQIQLKTAILNRMIKVKASEFDLRISTGNELALSLPSIQYIHLPIFNRRNIGSPLGVDGIYAYYDKFVSRLADVDADSLRGATLLTNSDWTARIIADVYKQSPEVLYPPVNVNEFPEVPWSKRKHRFVTLGRISPDKRLTEIIEIIRRVRTRGHDVELQVIGPKAKHNKYYVRKVEEQSKRFDFVNVAGKVTREELVSMISSSKFGIHGKYQEHFGISVAELVAGGTLPFVPDSGGQVELVNRQPDLLYQSVNDGVNKIDEVLSDPARQRRLMNSLPNVDEAFGKERFQDEAREIVETHI